MFNGKILLKKFHEPISASSSNSYMGLCTVVQAFPLAVLFWVIGQKEIYDVADVAFASKNLSALPYEATGKALVVVLIVALIWHRYSTDLKFNSWSLTAVDTLIPFSFAMFESFLAISIRASSSSWFLFWICALLALGSLAYINIVFRLVEEDAVEILAEHFESMELGMLMRSNLLKHAMDALTTNFIFFVLFFVLWIVLIEFNTVESVKSVIIILISVLAISVLFLLDANRKLMKIILDQ